MRHFVGCKSIYHQNGDRTTRCCDCNRILRLPEQHWTRVEIGGDAWALMCPACDAAQLERQAKEP